MNQIPPSFQAVISTYGRMSPNIWVFKKLKYKKLRLVNLGQNVLPALFAGEPERKMDSNKVNKLIVEGGGGSSCEEVL